MVGNLQAYIQARMYALQQNINDIITAASSGFWEDLLHTIGFDAQTVLSRRMELRRAWARKVLFHPELLNRPPRLPPYGEEAIMNGEETY